MTMKRITQLKTALLLGIFLGEALSVAQTKSKPFDLGGGFISLPSSVNVQKRQGPDFDLFYFTVANPKDQSKPKRQVLFAYAGNHPSFPSEGNESVPETKMTINGYAARNLSWRAKDGRLNREVLVTLGKSQWANVIHFAYDNLSKSDAKIADGMIASIRTHEQKK